MRQDFGQPHTHRAQRPPGAPAVMARHLPGTHWLRRVMLVHRALDRRDDRRCPGRVRRSLRPEAVSASASAQSGCAAGGLGDSGEFLRTLVPRLPGTACHFALAPARHARGLQRVQETTPLGDQAIFGIVTRHEPPAIHRSATKGSGLDRDPHLTTDTHGTAPGFKKECRYQSRWLCRPGFSAGLGSCRAGPGMSRSRQFLGNFPKNHPPKGAIECDGWWYCSRR